MSTLKSEPGCLAAVATWTEAEMQAVTAVSATALGEEPPQHQPQPTLRAPTTELPTEDSRTVLASMYRRRCWHRRTYKQCG